MCHTCSEVLHFCWILLLKKTSPYGVDVRKGLSDYLTGCDKSLTDAYLKTTCHSLAVILKRQRGKQYGLGDDSNSQDLITKNLTDDFLDDEDITTTKPIENLFGNLDRELKKVGTKGFEKTFDDLIIKSSKDLIVHDKFQWRTKANRKNALELKVLDQQFSDSQKALAKLNADESDLVMLTPQNKILKYVLPAKKNMKARALPKMKWII